MKQNHVNNPDPAFLGERLRQARVVAALTQEEVVTLLLAQFGLKLTKAGLSKYEKGGSAPKAAMLRALIKVLGVNADFFLEKPPVEVRWLAFRMASTLRQQNQERIKTVAAVQVESYVSLQEALEPGRKDVHCPRTRVASPQDAEVAAANLRAHWKLGDQPIESVTTVIEDAGGIVLEVGGEEDSFDGLSGWASECQPVVVISPSLLDDRRRFSLAHELGHLFMDVGNVESKTEEKLAHRFASAFLVPPATARRELGEKRRHLDFRELAILKLKYGLSMQAWIYRAWDLGIIEQSHLRSLFAEMTTRGWRRVEPCVFKGKEKPMRLRQLTVRAHAEGLLSDAQANRICPGALADPLTSGTPAIGSLDPRTLLKLPKEERHRLLEQAAALAEADYQSEEALGEFGAMGEEDAHDPDKE